MKRRHPCARDFAYIACAKPRQDGAAQSGFFLQTEALRLSGSLNGHREMTAFDSCRRILYNKLETMEGATCAAQASSGMPRIDRDGDGFRKNSMV